MLMTKLIKHNKELVKQILNDSGISETIMWSMARIYNLKEDFESIHFSPEERGLWWEAEITLKNRINSQEEFIKYLKNNSLFNEDKPIGGYGDEIYRPDYILTMGYGKGKGTELRCNFYNPDKVKHKDKR
jgi:hypothetical protein